MSPLQVRHLVEELLMPQINKRQHGGCSEESSGTHHRAEAVPLVSEERRGVLCERIDEQYIVSSCGQNSSESPVRLRKARI